MNDKKIPMKEPDNVDIYICPAASWGDMTGLIPTGNGGEYADLYPYLPQYQGDTDI